MEAYRKYDNGVVINTDDTKYKEILKNREINTLQNRVSYLEKQLTLLSNRVLQLEKG